jgi:hypothetical protein
MMKKILLLIVAICGLLCASSCVTSGEVQPRFKMLSTQNLFIFLKLDTATGKIWMVQYGMGDRKGVVVPLDDTSLLDPEATEVNGRYELYSTENMFTYILLDTQKGNTYQVQWNIEEENRFRIPLN